MNLTVSTPVAAGAIADTLVGTNAEFLTVDSLVEIALSCTAVGMLASISSGMDIIQEESPVFVIAAGIAPKYPDDFSVSDVAPAGQRLRVRIRNTTAGTLTVLTTVRATQI